MLSPATIETATAADARRRLLALEGERAEAVAAGLGSNALYMADLDRDIEACRAALVGVAVTEIAALRASLDGPLQG